MTFFSKLKIEFYKKEEIEKESFGQITNSRTINPRNFKPESRGLFAPEIFGPSVNYECACGKYSGSKDKFKVCDQCKVEVISNKVSRYRMGHISLSSIVLNPIILKCGFGSVISDITNLSLETIENLIYYKNNSHIVISAGFSSEIKEKELITSSNQVEFSRKILNEMNSSGKFDSNSSIKKEIKVLLDSLEVDRTRRVDPDNLVMFFFEDYIEFFAKHWKIVVGSGAKSLFEILKKISFQEELNKLLDLLKKTKKEGTANNSQINSINKKAIIFRDFIKNSFSFEDIFIKNLPVIPSGLRPAVKLPDGNSIATSFINNFYRSVFLSNERLEDFKSKSDIYSSEMINQEKAMLQISVDRLFHGSETNKSESMNDAKSLSASISGKQGYFRHYCLGKRVDYSARSVIVPNSKLKINEFGLPVIIALKLYSPFIINKLLSKNICSNVKSCIELIDKKDEIIFPILREVVKNHPCVLNRAPTLHRLGLQGFYPVLTSGKSFQIHPLKTSAFNADFDGDQMALYLALSKKSREEVSTLMLSSNNIVNPQNNKIIDMISQDMILGIYFLTTQKRVSEKLNIYYKVKDILHDYKFGKIKLQEVVVISSSLLGKQFSNSKNTFTFTTPGKIIFNNIIPSSFNFYINELENYKLENIKKLSDKYNISFSREEFSEKGFDLLKEFYSLNIPSHQDGWKKNDIIEFVNSLLKVCKYDEIVTYLDDLKDLGFKYSSKSGITFSPFDFFELKEKDKLIEEAKERSNRIDEDVYSGFLDKETSSNQKINIWSECKEKIEKILVEKLNINKESSLYSIWKSGAKSSTENLMQISAITGNVVNYEGKIIDTPVISSLMEGYSVNEFVIAAEGALKGIFDTSLKTADAGYLYRKLYESVQNVVVNKNDCLTEEGYLAKGIKDNDYPNSISSTIVSLKEMVYGRFNLDDIYNDSGEIILEKNTLILDQEWEKLSSNNIIEVKIRNLLNCNLFPTVCQMCYGIDLSRQNSLVEIGTPVGIIASQSLGEPGTQLTMRTFHSGGVTGKVKDIVQGLPYIKEMVDNITPDRKIKSFISKISGVISKIEFDEITNTYKVIQKNSEKEISYLIPGNREIKVSENQFIEAGQKISSGKVDLSEIISFTNREKYQEYLTSEILKVYLDQGIRLNNKHVELFIRQMISKVEVVKSDYENPNLLIGDIINYTDSKEISKKSTNVEFKQIIFGVKELVNHFDSFLSSISFQNTYKSLLKNAISNSVDKLVGVKENLIVGQTLPIGSGLKYRQLNSSKKRT